MINWRDLAGYIYIRTQPRRTLAGKRRVWLHIDFFSQLRLRPLVAAGPATGRGVDTEARSGVVEIEAKNLEHHD